MVGDIEQIDAIVRQFLDYARRTPQAPAEDIELAPLIEAVVRRGRIDAQPAASVEMQLAPDVVVRGHRTELERALDNLLTNAVRYGRDPATGALAVDVRMVRANDRAVIAVADRGNGVSPDEIDRLMRPFERGDAARSGGSGAGLGLPIVERIARMHGGSLRLLANAPQGLRAELTLPLARAQAP
jgi:two-component system osmolarity sensor histidine kinase EnvZ